MTLKSRADMRCGVFCQVPKVALGGNGRAVEHQDDVDDCPSK